MDKLEIAHHNAVLEIVINIIEEIKSMSFNLEQKLRLDDMQRDLRALKIKESE